MVRVVHRLSPIVNFLMGIILVAFLVVFGYCVFALGNLIYSLILGGCAFALALILTEANRGYAWEVDSAGFRMLVGERVIESIPLKEIGHLTVAGSPKIGRVWLSVIDKSEAKRIDLGTGVELSVDDIQRLYEAATYYLKTYDAQVSNPFGWAEKPLLAREIVTQGEYPKMFRGEILHLPLTLILTGIQTLALGVMKQTSIVILAGIALTFSGIAIPLAKATKRWRNRNRHDS